MAPKKKTFFHSDTTISSHAESTLCSCCPSCKGPEQPPHKLSLHEILEAVVMATNEFSDFQCGVVRTGSGLKYELNKEITCSPHREWDGGSNVVSYHKPRTSGLHQAIGALASKADKIPLSSNFSTKDDTFAHHGFLCF